MPSEEDLKKLKKELDASASKPAPMDPEAIGLRERQPHIEPVRDNRVLEMFNQILDRLNSIDRKIDELKNVQEPPRSR